MIEVGLTTPQQDGEPQYRDFDGLAGSSQLLQGGEVKRNWPETPETKSGENDKKPSTIETVDNHVYFYNEVERDRCLALVKTLRELDAKLRAEHITRQHRDTPLTPIWLHIQSPGGELFTAIAVASQIRLLHSPVYSVVEGYAASAATIISVVCNKRFILPDSYMLIHQLSTFTGWIKYEDLKDEVHLCDMLMQTVASFYKRHTKLTDKAIGAFLKRDSWFNAHECIDKGLIDEALID